MDDDYREHNRAWWNEAVRFHITSDFYRLGNFRQGENVLDPIARDRVGNIAGKRVFHLQCHFGLDTLSLARMGAEVTGLDFSPSAISAAIQLAKQTGVFGRFVEGDVLDPPPGLKDFDIVFASWGVLAWIQDVRRWMCTAADALRPGGVLLLFEGHPAMYLFDDQVDPDSPFVLRYPYDSLEPHIEEVQGTYADPKAVLKSIRTVTFFHGLSRILTAAIDAGFTVQKFEEFDRVPWKGLPQLIQVDDFYWAMPPGAPFVPLSFALRCKKS